MQLDTATRYPQHQAGGYAVQITKRCDKVALNDKIILPNGAVAYVTMIQSDDNTVCFCWFESVRGLIQECRMYKNKHDHIDILIGH